MKEKIDDRYPFRFRAVSVTREKALIALPVGILIGSYVAYRLINLTGWDI